jgi:hypothetical protein
MWLALSSVVLASAIGFNVVALWLTGWFERDQPPKPEHECRSTRALGLRRTAVDVLLKTR